MNMFLKASAVVLLAVILWLCLNKHSKDMAVLLSLAVCAGVLIAAIAVLQPVIDFFGQIQKIGSLDSNLVSVVLKAVGIGLISEICVLVCKDAGNESIGKTLQIMATAVILWMSIPVFEQLLSLLEEILGKV